MNTKKKKRVNSALDRLYPNKPDSKIEFCRLAQLTPSGNLLGMLNPEPHFEPIIVDQVSQETGSEILEFACRRLLSGDPREREVGLNRGRT